MAPLKMSRVTQNLIDRYPSVQSWIEFMVEAFPAVMLEMADAAFGNLHDWFDDHGDDPTIPPTRGCMIGTAALVMHRTLACAAGEVNWERDAFNLVTEFAFKCRREGHAEFVPALRKRLMDREAFVRLTWVAGVHAGQAARRTGQERAVAAIKEYIIVAFANTP